MRVKQKPSEKIQRRYILLSGDKKKVEGVLLDVLGVLGWSRAAPLFVGSKGKTVLAVRRESLGDVRAGLELSDSNIKISKVSGTLKGLGIRKV